MKKILSVFLLTSLVCACHVTPDIEPPINTAFSIYPNPARFFATINVRNRTENSTLLVFDTKGKIFATFNVTPQQGEYNINFQDEPAGTYHVVLKTRDSVVTDKLIKDE